MMHLIACKTVLRRQITHWSKRVARFFFNTADGVRDVDRDGVELEDRTEASKEAVRYAGALMKDDPDLVWNGHDFRVEVLGEDGCLVCTVVVLAVHAPQPS